MKEKYCRYCLGNIQNNHTFLDYMKQNEILCGDCKSKLHIFKQYRQVEELSIYSWFVYDEFMEQLFFQFKEGKDIALKEVFLFYIQKAFKRYMKHSIVVIPPSNKHKCIERGFIPLQEILSTVGIQAYEPFYKNDEYKQSDQNMKHRHQITNVLKLIDHFHLPNQDIVLVDDVCASGYTLLSAYRLLKGAYCNSIKVTTIASTIYRKSEKVYKH